MDILKNINNKEILTEVLHLSVDYLMGNINDHQTFRLSHKYGFGSPDDFLLATRCISKYYSRCCLDHREMESTVSWSPELCCTVFAVLNARQPEVFKHLEHCEFSRNKKLVKAFSWDTRLIIGNSSFGGTITQVVTVNFFFGRLYAQDHNLVFQMDKLRLQKLIAILEKNLSHKTLKGSWRSTNILRP